MLCIFFGLFLFAVWSLLCFYCFLPSLEVWEVLDGLEGVLEVLELVDPTSLSTKTWVSCTTSPETKSGVYEIWPSYPCAWIPAYYPTLVHIELSSHISVDDQPIETTCVRIDILFVLNDHSITYNIMQRCTSLWYVEQFTIMLCMYYREREHIYNHITSSRL